MKTFCKSFLCFFLALSLCGCSAFQRQSPESEESVVEDTVTTFTNMKDLTSGRFYILHNGRYQELYIGDASFDTSSTASSAGNARTCWFQEDFEKVPTLYAGDSLIYCNDSYMDETFRFERFEYVGYTIGICNLSKRSSGRYSFNAQLEDNKKQIAVNSDAYKLYELANNTAVIETLGGARLLEGNVTRGGVIKGLKKDGKYKAQIYVGTQVYEYSLIADSIALTSMDTCTLNEYSFLESRVAEIKIPDYFNSGYYTLNGKGMFRYVKGRTYNAGTDFNVPNVKPEKDDAEKTESSAAESTSSGDIASSKSDTVTKRFTLDKSRKITATLTWKDPESNAIYAAPTAKIIGDAAAYSLSRVQGTNTLTIVKTLEPGTYRVVIEGLDGREYEIKVE